MVKTFTTIGLSIETKKELDRFKIRPDQSYEEVINFLIQKKHDEMLSAKKTLNKLYGVSGFQSRDPRLDAPAWIAVMGQ